MDIINSIVNTPVREISGAHSSKAFDYQKNWALAQLLEYHQDGNDYVFAFEFHDDILVLNSEINPYKADFFQVKTSRGRNWSIKRLTTQETSNNGNPKLSILGKLYQHKIDFSDHDVKLHFVTDAFFSFKIDGNTFWINEIEIDKQNELKDEIRIQFPQINSSNIDDLCFHHSEITLEGHETYIKGKLHDFFSHCFGDDHNIPVNTWYKTISDDIRKKNNYPPSNIKTVDELIRNKCITKREIEDFLQKVKSSRKTKPNWDIICQKLTKLNYATKDLICLGAAWNEFSMDILDRTNELLEIVCLHIQKKLNIFEENQLSLTEFMDFIYNEVRAFLVEKRVPYSRAYINAIILWKYSEEAAI